MQALILAGGEGTRLRPLTAAQPKPVVPFVDRPFIAYMLDWLRSHGVDEVVMACGFLADGVRAVLGSGGAYGVRLHYVEEPEPLGTGGALKFAEDLLDERFLMLNGDVLCDFDLTALIAHHDRAGASGTIALVEVEDPSAYGLVQTRPDGEVLAFVEKPGPEDWGSRRVNAGSYVLERDRVLGLMAAGAPASIERDVFPRLVGDGLHGWMGAGYWLDIGTPERYLTGSFDILEGAVATPVAARMGAGRVCVADDAVTDGQVVGAALLERGVRVLAHARVGGRVVLGENVTVGEHSTVEGAVVLEGAAIGARCVVRDCVIGPGARIGDGCLVDGQAMIGAGVTVGAGNVLTNGIRLFSGVDLPDHGVAF